MRKMRTTFEEIHRYMQRFTISIVVIFAIFMNLLFLYLQLQEERIEMKPVHSHRQARSIDITVYAKDYLVLQRNDRKATVIENNLTFNKFYTINGERHLVKITKDHLLLKGLDVIIHKQLTLLAVTIISILVICVIACYGSKKLVTYVAHNIRLVLEYIENISSTSVPVHKNIHSLPENDELQSIVVTVREKNEEIQAHINHLQRVIAYIQHEFNTPLTSLKLRSDEIEENPDSLHTHLPKIQSTIQHLSGLVQALTQIVKVTQSDLHKQPVSLADLSKEIRDELANLHQSKDLTLSVTSPASITLNTDYYLVRTIRRNLIHNAVKYAPKGSAVEVILTDSTAMIKDHGPGIPKDQLKNIRLPFRQGDVSRGLDEGFGLGLSLVRTIVDKLGRRINVLSSGNLGTTFILERSNDDVVTLSDGR